MIRKVLLAALLVVALAAPGWAISAGGQHTVSATATVLDSSDVIYTYITIRLEPGASILYFGNSDVTAVPANAHGYLVATATDGNSWTFGPYPNGGIRPSAIYIIGTADDVLFWNAG